MIIKKRRRHKSVIDCRRVNQLKMLMVHPMLLISELLQDMDKLRVTVLWTWRVFWVVEMTEKARAISAVTTPSGLCIWLRMPFGLKNAPQIYQRLIDNALYGFLKIGERSESITAGLPKLIVPSLMVNQILIRKHRCWTEDPISTTY